MLWLWWTSDDTVETSKKLFTHFPVASSLQQRVNVALHMFRKPTMWYKF